MTLPEWVQGLPDPERMRKIDHFAQLCEMARPLGLTVDLEFPSWTETPDLSEAARVLRAADQPNAGILVDLLHFALGRAPKTGLVLEFGVEKGASIRWLAKHTDRTVHGFDSFRGLPNDWTGTKETAGKFDMRGKLPKVPANVQLHVGWFVDTIPSFLDAHPGPTHH